MDVIPHSSLSTSLLSRFASRDLDLFEPIVPATGEISGPHHNDQMAPQDSFVNQEPSLRPWAAYSPARPAAASHGQPDLNGLSRIMALLRSLGEDQLQSASMSLTVRQSIAFTLEARNAMGSLPENSQEAFGDVALKMIGELLRDARILFKTMLQFARVARKLGLENQPVTDHFLRVVGKLLDSFPELLNSFVPAFADAQAGHPARAAADFLSQIGAATDGLSSSANVSVAASFLTEVEVMVDGGTVRLEARVSAEVEATVSVQQADPIAIDVDGDGILKNPGAAFVPFDITGDGKPEKVQLPGSDSALLAIDSNGNGLIDGGHELFGTQRGARNGFEELAKWDHNQDGVIDLLDPVFKQILLFTDANADGHSQPEELLSLAAAGISSLSLQYTDLTGFAESDLAQRSTYTNDDGSAGTMWDVLLKYVPA